MAPKGVRLLIAFATAIVFTWSVVMVAFGQVTAIAVLAPALGLTVQQIVRPARTQVATEAARPQAVPEAGRPASAAPESGGEAP